MIIFHLKDVIDHISCSSNLKILKEMNCFPNLSQIIIFNSDQDIMLILHGENIKLNFKKIPILSSLLRHFYCFFKFNDSYYFKSKKKLSEKFFILVNKPFLKKKKQLDILVK